MKPAKIKKKVNQRPILYAAKPYIMTSSPDPLTFFRLKPIQVARVSEISEATAAAPVPPEERVNFHIGNPLQDERLSSCFLRIALGIDVNLYHLRDSEPDLLLDYLGWDQGDKPKLETIIRTIQRSSPYMPRGGYSRKSPHALIKAFCSWLESQQEPLHYGTGETSGRREIILASGGIHEALRIFLFALSSSLEITPAVILCYRFEIPTPFKTIANLEFRDLSLDESEALNQMAEHFSTGPSKPTFMLIGETLSEQSRRSLRTLSINKPLFFIELNDAPNHLSLAREAKLVQRVIRFLTPGIFAQRLRSLSTLFIAGNADFLNVLENVHFSMKGTPSASEVEFLIYLLQQHLTEMPEDPATSLSQVKPSFEGLGYGIGAEGVLPKLAERAQDHIESILKRRAEHISQMAELIEGKAFLLSQKIQRLAGDGLMDEFAGENVKELFDQMVERIHEPAWGEQIQDSFLAAFVRHQPQYDAGSCMVVSGSSRTALGILGYHCGITEVVIADLSWSYEQCFPVIHAVPLTPSLDINGEAMIAKVQALLRQDPSWGKRGAVALNNPHNATGKILDGEAIHRLVAYCLHHNIFVIDDLAYQNVVPVDELPEIKTIRQIAENMVKSGEITTEQAKFVITVHSMSKTDCLAGARLAVVEIRDVLLRRKYEKVNSIIKPNLAAIFICYLFYRNSIDAANTYWQLRNSIFSERSQSLVAASENLSPDRNPFGLTIIRPTGSMYPLLQVGELPAGLSLDWLASSLARRGIGLLPLSTFARTEEGYEIGRTTFRLTLGGVDNAEILLTKTRRLLIDLNRLIAEEDSRYNRKLLTFRSVQENATRSVSLSHAWDLLSAQILQSSIELGRRHDPPPLPPLNEKRLVEEFLNEYGPGRLDVFRQRLLDRARISDELTHRAMDDNSSWLEKRLEQEFMKDSLSRRQELFRLRSYDRTVHPTQMYSLQAEVCLNEIITALIENRAVESISVNKAAKELWREFLGRNVSINSQQEADEIILDLSALIYGEEHAEQFSNTSLTSFLSFWSDWDGSNRPSGQGHSLVASVVMENVRQMSQILNLFRHTYPQTPVNPKIIEELDKLPQRNERFLKLLNDITLLTHQLEQRYRGILPFSMDTTSTQRLATRLHLRRDPARIMWQHNDRYEEKMIALRKQRRGMLEYYCSLNKQLRKQLYSLIPAIKDNRLSEPLLRQVVGYRDILQRTVITPRIHQSQVTARDQFAIDTTIYNMYEINTITGTYGNPGFVLAMQVSFSSKPEALISLDRKIHIQAERMRRDYPDVEHPSIWLIPLVEDVDSVKNIRAYLDRVWEYADQSRQAAQTSGDRFAEIIPEVFIAGSDLSQQVGQAAGAMDYLRAKYNIQKWLAEHGSAECMRIKLGSGEPMQRQGGYYSEVAGKPAFSFGEDTRRRLVAQLPPAVRRSTDYAVTPLQGVYLANDLRTFQSNLSEQLRFLPVKDFVSLLHHVKESQRNHRANLIRAAETIAESRLSKQSRTVQELERLTIGENEELYDGFLTELSENFRQILYGREEDVIGIHIISYFIGRSMPQLRDRPTSRRIPEIGAERGQQILANIAKIIPLSKQGSLLRAIAHNQAQSAVLGVNQLTTGLFRALQRFAQKTFAEAERDPLTAEHLLPHLPVYEILMTLRLYQDNRGVFLKQVENAFPAGNSAFVALREDGNAMNYYLPLFQQELLRRHGVNVSEFYQQGYFNPELLPTLRPDLAVLLQRDLFNTDVEQFLAETTGKVDPTWREEVERLLMLPARINEWRTIIWQVLGESVYQRVQSFSELATALYSFSSNGSHGPKPTIARGGGKISPALTGFFRTARPDDEMRNFLVDAIEYLNSYAEGNIEVPVSIIRAINDVEHIAQIEEVSLPPEKQDVLRTCTLQIARLAGENG